MCHRDRQRLVQWRGLAELSLATGLAGVEEALGLVVTGLELILVGVEVRFGGSARSGVAIEAPRWIMQKADVLLMGVRSLGRRL